MAGPNSWCIAGGAAQRPLVTHQPRFKKSAITSKQLAEVHNREWNGMTKVANNIKSTCGNFIDS